MNTAPAAVDTGPPDLELSGRALSHGVASGPALVTRERISFWGGFDPRTGRIVDPYHELRGCDVRGRVLVFQSFKGSSGGSSVLDVARQLGTTPAAMINVEIDALAVLSCQLIGIPLIRLQGFDPFELIATGDRVRVDGDNGLVQVWRAAKDDR